MYGRGAQSYFNRSGNPQPDGRAYDQRVLEAVNSAAADVTSYRELVSALGNAEDGTVITISEEFAVPSTILVTKNRITFTCVGRGGLVPATLQQTLFDVVDVDDVYFYRVKVLRNKKEQSFKTFVDFDYETDKKNIYIEECYVEADTFFKSSIDINALGLSFTPTALSESDVTDAYYENWLGQRSFIINNTHRTYEPVEQLRRFIWGNAPGGFNPAAMWMTTITGNETNGYIEFTGSGNIIDSNVVLGRLDRLFPPANPANHSSITAHDRHNIITSNLIRNVTNTGGSFPVSAPGAGTTPPYVGPPVFNIVSNNLELNP